MCRPDYAMMRLIAFVLLFSLCAVPAYAGCSNPPGNEGDVVYNHDYHVVQFCNGTDWIQAGGSSVMALSNLSDVNVSGATNGQVLTYSSAAGKWTAQTPAAGGASAPTCPDGDYQVASGGAWVCSSTKQPDAFSFTDQPNAQQSGLIASNIVQITGLFAAQSTSISGGGSPEYQICSDVACSSVVQAWTSSASTIQNNQYLQLRLTSSSSPSTPLTATMTVGTTNADWTVTTFLVTSGSQAFTSGTTSFTVPAYNTLTIWLKAPGGGGGGGSVNRIAANGSHPGGTGDTGSSSQIAALSLLANGGTGGTGGQYDTLTSTAYNGSAGSPGTASGGDTNTTGGGAGGGAGGLNYPPNGATWGAGGTGGAGGYVSKTYTYGASGAPVVGDTLSVVIGAAASGGAAYDGAGTAGGAQPGGSSTAGSGNATWN